MYVMSLDLTYRMHTGATLYIYMHMLHSIQPSVLYCNNIISGSSFFQSRQTDCFLSTIADMYTCTPIWHMHDHIATESVFEI